MAGKVKTDELTQFHDYSVYTPARIISLSGDIDEEKAVEFIKNIRILDHTSSQDITILINTGGGEVHQGMAIYDAIKECKSKVITHAVGPCWSMGAIILQAGDTRKISASATVMIHVGSEEYGQDHAMQIERWVKENKRISSLADNILYQRIKQKKPKFKKEQLKAILVFDTIYTAKQVVDMGLADEIEDHKEYVQNEQ